MNITFNHQYSLLASFLFLLSVGFAQAQIEDRPKAGAEQKKLGVFAGDWTYEGQLMDTPLGPGGKFTGKLTNRMALDGLFLETRGEDNGVYGGKEMVYKSVAMTWYDPTTKAYPRQSFDNDGFVSRSEGTVNGNTWTYTGSMTDSKGKAYKTRTTTTLSSDGKAITTKSEMSADDGKTWMPYWETKDKKVGN